MPAGCGTTTTRSYMPGFFDTIAQIPERGPKKFFVIIEGQQHEVTFEKKLWSQQHGEENLTLKDGEIVLKPKPKPKTQYRTLLKSERGYFFEDQDIHWPNDIAEGGVTWQIESE